MKALIVEATNIEEITCTETASQTNTFIPSPFIYRTAISGTLLRVCLHLRGIDYSNLYNLALNQSRHENDGRLYLSAFYNSLLDEMLPDVAITDAMLDVESGLRKEVFNVIYDGTSTAIGSLKTASSLQLALKDFELTRDRKGNIVLRKVRMDQNLPFKPKLCPYHFLHFSSMQLRESLSYKEHLFRIPGARWRLALIGKNQDEVKRAFELFNVASTELGFGAKHSFRGKIMILDTQFTELEEINSPVEAELFQPLICRIGNLSDNLAKLKLEPTGEFKMNWRLAGFRPKATAVPAVWGKFRANEGYQVTFKERSYIITSEDLLWPKNICDN